MSEHDEQKRYMAWLKDNHPEVDGVTTSTANGAYMGHNAKAARQMAKLKAAGLKTGFPDVIMLYPCGDFHGLAIEMKALDGGVISKEQLEWRERLLAQGFAHAFCNGADAAITATKTYLSTC